MIHLRFDCFRQSAGLVERFKELEIFGRQEGLSNMPVQITCSETAVASFGKGGFRPALLKMIYMPSWRSGIWIGIRRGPASLRILRPMHGRVARAMPWGRQIVPSNLSKLTAIEYLRQIAAETLSRECCIQFRFASRCSGISADEAACRREPRVLKTPSSIRQEKRNHPFTRKNAKGGKIKGVRYPLSKVCADLQNSLGQYTAH